MTGTLHPRSMQIISPTCDFRGPSPYQLCLFDRRKHLFHTVLSTCFRYSTSVEDFPIAIKTPVLISPFVVLRAKQCIQVQWYQGGGLRPFCQRSAIMVRHSSSLTFGRTSVSHSFHPPRAVSSPDYGLLSKFLIEQSVQVQNKSNPSALKATDYNRALIHSHHQNSRWKLKRRLGKTPREAKFF